MFTIGQICTRHFSRLNLKRYITTQNTPSSEINHKESPLNGVRILDLTRIGMCSVRVCL